MSYLRSLVDGLRALIRREAVNRELDEEVSSYLAMAAEEKMKRGMSREDARRTVRLESGSAESAKEAVRSAGWEFMIESSWQDIRYGLRRLLREPAFTAVAVV